MQQFVFVGFSSCHIKHLFFVPFMFLIIFILSDCSTVKTT